MSDALKIGLLEGWLHYLFLPIYAGTGQLYGGVTYYDTGSIKVLLRYKRLASVNREPGAVLGHWNQLRPSSLCNKERPGYRHCPGYVDNGEHAYSNPTHHHHGYVDALQKRGDIACELLI